MYDHYLDDVRRKYEDFIEENRNSKIREVSGDLKSLINEIVSVTWDSAIKEVEERLRSEGY